MDICQKCGLLKEICACDMLEKQQPQSIKVYTTTKKFKKLVTIVEGVGEGIDGTAKLLKSSLACGGTVKDGLIVLQGDHKRKVKGFLVTAGYKADDIVVY